jgi:putative hydrolase of the HAD superfamily
VIRAVVFDFYGTLAYSPDGHDTLATALAEHGYSVAPDLEHRWWNDIDGTEHHEHSGSREQYTAWQDARLRATLQACAVDAEHLDPIAARVNELLATRAMTPYDEVADVMAALRTRGTVVAICSNWSWGLNEALALAGLHEAADLTISSAWIGCRKPHPKIYAHTLDALRIGSDEAMFVGDTWSCDVEGPRAAGMQTLYLRRAGAATDHTAPDTLDIPVVTDLTAVLQ